MFNAFWLVLLVKDTIDWFLPWWYIFSIEIDALTLVEGLSSMLKLCLCILACWISASRSLMTLLLLEISYLLNDLLAPSVWDDSIKELYHLVVNRTDPFLWCDNSTFDWSSYNTGRCWFVVLSYSLNVNLIGWVLCRG